MAVTLEKGDWQDRVRKGSPALGKTLGGATILRPSSDHTYHVPLSRTAIVKYQVVDVDIVLEDKAGHRIILQGAAADAFADPSSHVTFTDSDALLGDLMVNVGEVRIDPTPLSAQSAPLQQSEANPQTHNEDADKLGDAPIRQTPVAQSTALLPSGGGQGANNYPFNPYISNIVFESPPAHTLPQMPAYQESNQVAAILLAKTGTTLGSGILTGAYGATGADTNASATAQMAPQVIANGSQNEVINANALAGQSFIKILHIAYSGTGSVTSFTLSGLPKGVSIVGATPDGNGVYSLSALQFASALGKNTFDLQLQYSLSDPNAATPDHQDFSASLNLTVKGATPAEYQKTVSFTISDALTATDITKASESDSKLVLPAQGISYQITAYGRDTVTGGRNDDTVYASGGSNRIDGAGGVNTLDYSSNTGRATIDATSGLASAGLGSDTFVNFQRFVGAAAPTVLIGSATTLYLASGVSASNDTFESGGGGSSLAPETILGGASGTNTLSYIDATAAVSVNLATGVASGFGHQTISNIQNLVGSAFNDTLTGASTTVSLAAGGATANVTFDPGGGGTAAHLETITGSTNGVNTLTYLSSAGGVNVNLETGLATGDGVQALSNIEIVIGSTHADTLTGTTTTRALEGMGGNDLFDGGGGGTVAAPESIVGGTGDNTISFANAPGGVDVNLTLGFATSLSGQLGYGYETLTGIQNIIGSSHSDSLVGAATTHLISGGIGGSDTIDPGGGGTLQAPETIIGGADGINLLTYVNATAGVTVNLSPGSGADGTAVGYGVQTLQSIQRVIGSAYSDSLRGASTTLELNGGSGGSDTFDGGGGGSHLVAETIQGNTSGVNTLTFARDSFGGVVANLQTHTADANLYGYEVISNIEVLIGSALGNDNLTGATTTLELEAGSDSASDTFDGGGGGTVTAPETILGGRLGSSNTLTFAADIMTAINANLASGIIDAGGQNGYGYEKASFIQRLIGSSHGGDTLTGGVGVTYLAGQSTVRGDTFDGGGGGTTSAPEYIVGQAGVFNTLTFSQDTGIGAAGAITVDLRENALGYGSVVGAYGYELVKNISEVIAPTLGDATLIGAVSGSVLVGGQGADELVTSGGESTLEGGTGSDTIIAQLGLNLIEVGLGVESITGPSSPSVTNSDTLSFANATSGVTLDLQAGRASGYGGEATLNGAFTEVIGSPFDDSLLGSATTLALIAGGPNSSDTFDGGGGGTSLTPETIQGSKNGINTLSFARDTVAPVNVNLQTGTVDGGGSAGYGYEVVSNIQRLIGSAYGGDTLIGASNTLSIDGRGAARAETFDGGGAGSVANPESILGATGLQNTLEFTTDNAPGSLGGVYVNLQQGVAYGLNHGYANLANIYRVIGSAAGFDTLIGASSGSVLQAGNGDSSLRAGGGFSTLIAGLGRDTLDGTLGANLLQVMGGAVSLIGALAPSASNADTLSYAYATGAVQVNLMAGYATGFGSETLSGIFTGLIGSDQVGDTLIGSSSTLYISGGAGTNGLIDPGGGGTAAAAETLVGGTGGGAILSFGQDSTTAIIANLSQTDVMTGEGDIGSDIVDGLGTVPGSNGYGYDQVSGFQILIGSAVGGDTLIGGPGVRLVTAGQATVPSLGLTFSSPSIPISGSTFDGGGGGTAAAPEYLIGSAQRANTLVFIADTAATSVSGVLVDLSQDTGNAGYGKITYGQVVEYVQNIHNVIGSASGPDTIIADAYSDSIRAGGGVSTLIATLPGGVNTLVGGAGGGTIVATAGQNSIDGGLGAVSILGGSAQDTLFFNDSLVSTAMQAGVVVDLSKGFATVVSSLGSRVETLTSSLLGEGAFVGLVGSQFNDTLIGSFTTQLIKAGSATSDDLIVAGGGGSSTHAETIIGAANGATTLSYATDSLGSISATLVAGAGFGTIAGTNGAYGYQLVANITELIGSAGGGDTLQGAANTLVLEAGGGALSATAIAGDTFIGGGGGGTLVAPESLIGVKGFANEVSFAADSVASVTINLATGIADARSNGGDAGYGYESLTNINEAVGSALGGDLLIGSSATLLLRAGPNASNDTFVAGGGGSSPTHAETIDGGMGGSGNTLDYSSDDLAALTVDLRQELGNAGWASSGGGQYGYQTLEGEITRLIGSGAGHDSLIGGVAVTYMQAAAGGDTLDGGGGGYLQKPETLVGYSATPATASDYTTLSFNADSVASVNVNLATGVVSSSGAAYGYEQVSNFQQVVGSAIGGDTLIGSSTTRQMTAGSGGNVSMIAGGGGTSAAPETLIGSSVGTNILDYGQSKFSVNANLGPTAFGPNGLVTSQNNGYGVQSVYNFQEFKGSAVGGDNIVGTQGYILLQAGAQATLGDTFDGGGGGTSAHAESVIGNTTAVNTLTFGQDLGHSLNVSLNGGAAGFAQSAIVIDGGGTQGYGYVVASEIQSLIGSAYGGDLFSASGALTGALASLTGSAVGNDTLSLASDSAASGVSIDLTSGVVQGLGSLDSVSDIFNFVGTAFGNDTFVTGAAPPSSLNGGIYVLTLGTGNDLLTLGASTDVIIGPNGGNEQIVLTSGPSWSPGQGDVLDLSRLATAASALIGAGTETLNGSTTGPSFSATVKGGLLSQIIAPTLAGALNVLSFSGTAPETVVADLGGSVNITVNGAAYSFKAVNFNVLYASSAGADTLIGGASDDTLSAAGQANVSIIGGSGRNLIIGGGGSDVINLTGASGGGTAGWNVVQVGTGNETIGFSTIASYFNSLSFANDSTTSVLANLSHTVAGIGSAATISGYGNDIVTGMVSALIGSSFGGDTLIGSAQTISLVGSASGGADTFDPGSLSANVAISGTSSLAASTLSFQNETQAGGQVRINLVNQTVQMSRPGASNGSINFLNENIHNVIGVGAGLSDTITADKAADLIVAGGGANTIIATSNPGDKDTLSFALDTDPTNGVAVNLSTVQDLGLAAGAIQGFGGGSLTGYFQYVIGGAGADTLIAGIASRYMFGGSGGGDLFDPMGAGTSAAPVSLVGGAGGGNTLTLASDTVGGANVRLSSDMVTIAPGGYDPGAGNMTGYGVASLSNIQAVIGSTFGYDTLDGGGDLSATVTLTGAANGTDLLTFANDTVLGDLGGVMVNLKTGSVSGGYGSEVIFNIHQVIGSPFGNDTLIGDDVADSFTLGGGADTVYAGGGFNTTIFAGTGSAMVHATAGYDILSFATDRVGGITETVTGSGLATTYQFADAGYGQGVTVTGGALYGIIGSAVGGDLLVGSPGLSELTAPAGANNDTFDGGGGGTVLHPEMIAGAPNTGQQDNTLTFQNDLVSGASGGVNINLHSGLVTSTVYGDEQVSGIHTVIGSAAGNDTFQADSNAFSESLTLEDGANVSATGGDSFTTGSGFDTIVGGINSDTINAQNAAGGLISSAPNHTGYDLITIGPSFYQSMVQGHASVAPGGGTNTLVLNWQGQGGKATSFDFTGITSTTTTTSAIKDITILDVSNNDPGGTTPVAYAITPQQIANMTNPSNHLLEINLSNNDSLYLALTNTQSIEVVKGGVENIYSSPIHNSSTLIASLVVI